MGLPSVVSLLLIACALTPYFVQECESSKLCNSISFDEFEPLVNNSLIIDMRKPTQFLRQGYILNSVNIPLQELDAALKITEGQFTFWYQKPKPSKETRIVLLSSAAEASNINDACDVLQAAGFTNWSIYSNAIEEWEARGKRLMPMLTDEEFQSLLETGGSTTSRWDGDVVDFRPTGIPPNIPGSIREQDPHKIADNMFNLPDLEFVIKYGASKPTRERPSVIIHDDPRTMIRVALMANTFGYFKVHTYILPAETLSARFGGGSHRDRDGIWNATPQ